MLRVTPIYGAHSHHPTSSSVALPGNCTLVEYGGVRLLVNVGLDDSFFDDDDDDEEEEGCRNPGCVPHDVDAVLLCDATLESLGGLPKFFSKLMHSKRQQRPLPVIYATYPVIQLGPMTLYDYHANVSLDGRNPGFTLDDVDAIFTSSSSISRERETTAALEGDITNKNSNTSIASTTTPTTISKSKVVFHTLKYSQSIPITSDGSLTLAPHRSGHVVGGAYWIVQRVADETSVVIALTYNPAKELHLDATTLLQDGCGAPDAFITRPGGAGGKLLFLYSSQQQNKNKNNVPMLSIPPARTLHANLIDQIMSVLRRDGHVLLPADACGRVFELLLLLDAHWTKHRLTHTYKLVWVSPLSLNIKNFVQAQLEWLSTNLGRQFDSQRGHPFKLQSFEICTSVAQVKELEREGLPMVCVASGASLDCGPARDLLLDWGQEAENAILFTDSQVCTLRSGTTYAGTNTNTATPASVAITSGSTNDTDIAALAPNIGELVDLPSTSSSAATIAVAVAEGSNSNKVGVLSHLSTAAQLLDKWCDAKLSGTEMEDEITVDVLVPTRSPLGGKDLLEFNAREERERRKRAAEEERIALLKEVELARGRLRLGEEDLARETNVNNIGGGDQTLSVGRIDWNEDNVLHGDAKGATTARKKSRFDSNLFLKYSKPLFMTFTDQEEAVGIGQDPSVARFGIGESIGITDSILVDDYGIAIVHDKFHDLVTGSDRNYSRQAGGTGRVGDDALWMRRGGGRSGASGVNSGGATNKPLFSATQQQSRSSVINNNVVDGSSNDVTLGTVVEDEAVDEAALEIADLSEGRGIIRGRNGRPPTKVFTVPRRMDVLAEVSYIPLEGRVTSRAARQSVRALQPRCLVVLGGASPPNHPRYRHHPSILLAEKEDNEKSNIAVITDDESNSHYRLRDGMANRKTWKGEARSLAETVLDVTASDQIFIPDNGETAELRVGHAAYSVRLIDTPYCIDGMDTDEKDEEEDAVPRDENSLFGADGVKVGQYTVRFVDCVATGQKVAADGSVVLAPVTTARASTIRSDSNNAIVARPHILLSDGEVLLTDLRSTMIAQGLKADYSTHSGYQQLVLNGRVVVTKDQASGRIHVEGPLCQDYFTVRSIVCAQYITL